jgi:hypothetical protein
MTAKAPIKPIRTFNSESRVSTSTQPSYLPNKEPPITSLEDLLHFPSKPVKGITSKDGGISSSTLGSYKCLSNNDQFHQSNIEMMEKREIWPEQRRIDKYFSGDKIGEYKTITKSQSTNQLSTYRMNMINTL